jgi:hypothetical protein
MTPELVAIRVHVTRLLRNFDRHKEPSADYIASVAAELDNLPPDAVDAAVSEVIRSEPRLENPVYQVRQAAAFLRGRVAQGDPLDALGPEGRQGWRERNPAIPGSPLDRLPAIPAKAPAKNPRR